MGAIKSFFIILFIFGNLVKTFAQTDSISTYKKKVLEYTEVDLLLGYYGQEGKHASVTGGVGNESLQNIAPSLVIRIPLNDDDILTVDVGFSSYTSASSSNGNPFNTGASRGRHDDDRENGNGSNTVPMGSPWVASTGASRQDILTTANFSYTHARDDRNRYWSANLGASSEYDYQSFGFGGGFTQLWNEKNTEITVNFQGYLDKWKPILPTEIHEFELYGNGFLSDSRSYFSGVVILNSNGSSVVGYSPSNFYPIDNVSRNSYSLSFNFSQIMSRRLQFSAFFDIVKQEGWLANPLQRVYFSDKPNFYIGNAMSIKNYENSSNTDVFHLADDIERLPRNRLKYPFGTRLNYYVNEYIVVRSYYRHYRDDWDINSNTFQLELPVKFNLKWKVTPAYRFYNQTAARYFAPYNQHLSSTSFYTSDYDLSNFYSHQLGCSLTYTDILSQFNLWKLALKNFSLRYQNYNRSDGLSAYSVSTAISFVLD